MPGTKYGRSTVNLKTNIYSLLQSYQLLEME